MKKYLAIVICCCLGLTMVPLYALADAPSIESSALPTPCSEADVWDGTINEPTQLTNRDGVEYYEISTAEELAYVAETGGDWLGYNYILTNDIILNNVEIQADKDGNCVNGEGLWQWEAIGNGNKGFSGIFDGGRHIISGLYIDSSSSYCGLFGYVNNGEVSELTLVNAYAKGKSYVGGVVGYASFSSVTGCTNYGYLHATGSYAGGIAGHAVSVKFESNRNYGEVRGEGDVGGIAGFAVVGSEFSDCFNVAPVVARKSGVGGIAGVVADSPIVGCYNLGTVVGDTEIGGIVGNVSSTVSNCLNCGYLYGGGALGGIVGTTTGNVEQCVNTGKIYGNGTQIGGICGRAYLYNYVRWGIADCFNTGRVVGHSCVGGVLGENPGYYSCRNCYSVGKTDGATLVGAIAGKVNEEALKQSMSGCYYLSKDGVAPIGNVDGGEGAIAATLEECLSAEDYPEWNFEEVWALNSMKNGGYPYLQWQDGVAEFDYKDDGPSAAVTTGADYSMGSLVLKDVEGNTLDSIPSDSGCWISVPITKQTEVGEAEVFLASYGVGGTFLQICSAEVHGLPRGAMIQLGFYIDGADVAKIKAFVLSPLFGLTPLGVSTEFPADNSSTSPLE